MRNVGGIDETTVTLEPGITVLVGRNATNRTSFLQAVMAAFGGDRATLKRDADEPGVVALATVVPAWWRGLRIPRGNEGPGPCPRVPPPCGRETAPRRPGAVCEHRCSRIEDAVGS